MPLSQRHKQLYRLVAVSTAAPDVIALLEEMRSTSADIRFQRPGLESIEKREGAVSILSAIIDEIMAVQNNVNHRPSGSGSDSV